MFFEPSRGNSRKFKQKPELKEVQRESIAYELMTFDELLDGVGQEFIFDVECYINYFLVSFKSRKTKRLCYLEMTDG